MLWEVHLTNLVLVPAPQLAEHCHENKVVNGFAKSFEIEYLKEYGYFLMIQTVIIKHEGRSKSKVNIT